MRNYFNSLVIFLKNHDWIIVAVMLIISVAALVIHKLVNAKQVKSDFSQNPEKPKEKGYRVKHFICLECQRDVYFSNRDINERCFTHLGIAHGICKMCSGAWEEEMKKEFKQSSGEQFDASANDN